MSFRTTFRDPLLIPDGALALEESLIARIEKSSEDPLLRFELGQVHESLHRPSDAVRDYTKAISLNDSYYEAILARGRLMMVFGDKDFGDLGFADFARCMDLRDSDAVPYFLRAYATARRGNIDMGSKIDITDALKDIEHVKRIRTGVSEVELKSVESMVLGTRFPFDMSPEIHDKAHRLAEEAVQLDAESPLSQLALGISFTHRMMTEPDAFNRGVVMIQRARALDPGDPYLPMLLAMYASVLEDDPATALPDSEMEEKFAMGVRLGPGFPTTYHLYGQFLISRKRVISCLEVVGMMRRMFEQEDAFTPSPDFFQIFVKKFKTFDPQLLVETITSDPLLRSYTNLTISPTLDEFVQISTLVELKAQAERIVQMSEFDCLELGPIILRLVEESEKGGILRRYKQYVRFGGSRRVQFLPSKAALQNQLFRKIPVVLAVVEEEEDEDKGEEEERSGLVGRMVRQFCQSENDLEFAVVSSGVEEIVDECNPLLFPSFVRFGRDGEVVGEIMEDPTEDELAEAIRELLAV